MMRSQGSDYWIVVLHMAVKVKCLSQIQRMYPSKTMCTILPRLCVLPLRDQNMPWLPYSNNIEEENIMVPTVVYNSLTCFLSEGGEGEEKKEKVNAKGHCQRLVLSLASKHVSLPLALKNLTSSKEVITLLNRYGHGISYYQGSVQ